MDKGREFLEKELRLEVRKIKQERISEETNILRIQYHNLLAIRGIHMDTRNMEREDVVKRIQELQ